jgi:hypothetical protein
VGDVAYFLLRVRSCTWPFCDNIFLRLCVRSKCESDTREGGPLETVSRALIVRAMLTYEIDANNQLRFTSSSSLYFNGISVCVLCGSHASSCGSTWCSVLRGSLSVLRRTALWWWCIHSALRRMSRRVSRSSCVDRRRATDHLRGWGARKACGQRALCATDCSWCG